MKTPEGIVECKPRGIFRKQKITPVACDEVTLETENGAAVAFSGLVYLVASLLISTFGIRRIMRFFPPVVTGPIIISIDVYKRQTRRRSTFSSRPSRWRAGRRACASAAPTMS